MNQPFVIFALPRSRTAWLSKFLSYGPWHCGHDELRHMRTLDDVRAWFSQPFTGTVETSGAPWWRLLKAYAPSARIVVVRRPVADVVDSLLNLRGISFDRAELTQNMEALDRKLKQIETRVANAISVDFDELNDERVCARVFDRCLGLPHDHGHWALWSPVNVQIDMSAMVRYALAYKPALDRLAFTAKQQTLALMNSRKPVAPDGISFQTETFDEWLSDAVPLFEQHCVIVGEPSDQWRRKNIPLMRRLYEIGAMQIMTARSNGRMFGYLMTLLSPSLTSQNLLSGVNATFFASPEFPGLGMKLQREAIRTLKERGVGEVFFEAGKRGSGERLGAMYRRLGALDHGQVFRMPLGGA